MGYLQRECALCPFLGCEYSSHSTIARLPLPLYFALAQDEERVPSRQPRVGTPEVRTVFHIKDPFNEQPLLQDTVVRLLRPSYHSSLLHRCIISARNVVLNLEQAVLCDAGPVGCCSSFVRLEDPHNCLKPVRLSRVVLHHDAQSVRHKGHDTL